MLMLLQDENKRRWKGKDVILTGPDWALVQGYAGRGRTHGGLGEERSNRLKNVVMAPCSFNHGQQARAMENVAGVHIKRDWYTIKGRKALNSRILEASLAYLWSMPTLPTVFSPSWSSLWSGAQLGATLAMLASIFSPNYCPGYLKCSALHDYTWHTLLWNWEFLLKTSPASFMHTYICWWFIAVTKSMKLFS